MIGNIQYFLFFLLSAFCFHPAAYGSDLCTTEFKKIINAGEEYELTPSELAAAIEYGFTSRVQIAAFASSSGIKQVRWAEYQRRTQLGETNSWTWDRWSKIYDINQSRVLKHDTVVKDLQTEYAWKNYTQTEYSVTVPFEHNRRLDLADTSGTVPKGVEVKTGYASLNLKARQQIEADAFLVQHESWLITWYFDGQATKPLLEALKKANIKYVFKNPEIDASV